MEHLVPVAEVLVLLVGGLITLLVGGVKGFAWLRNGWREDLKATLAEWADAHESRHQAHENEINLLRERTTDGFKRAHERIDAIIDRMPPA
jgi:hypothetical protein